MTVLEKHPLKKIGGYVLQLSPIKKVKSDATKNYFDLSFQTEKVHVLAVCFFPEKWKRLETCNLQGKSCVINNVFRTKKNQNSLLEIVQL